jgi:para-aminobenzoate synthetase component 1
MSSPLTKADAAVYLNRLGAERSPCLFIIDFERRQPIVLPLADIDNSRILFDIRGRRNYDPAASVVKRPGRFSKQPVSYETYERLYRKVFKHIYDGDSYLVNLTLPTLIETDLTLQELFFTAEAKYKLMIGGRFTVFSPECFIRIENGMISTFPMKGTIDASIPDAERIILDDPKETAEHVTVTDLLRNDLSMVADAVRVEAFRYTERITTNTKNLLQVSSRITGRLPSDYRTRLGDILFTLLPAGSICGAPKRRTVEIILENEIDARGYYTGIFGIYDGETVDAGVMIRFIEQREGSLFYRSGGGITAWSDPKLEYQELIDKIYVPLA